VENPSPLTLAFLDEGDKEGAPLIPPGERVRSAASSTVEQQLSLSLPVRDEATSLFPSPLIGEAGWG